MSWRDDVGSGAYVPVRAGWEILDAARSIAFTGEIHFPLLPQAQVYLDRGRIYYAERADDPDVADRLVALGVVRPDDLARGVVVSGGDDHLGLLFERVPALDRSRVVLALEHVTGDTVAWIAGQSVAEAASHPYVYHPSGVHRWYLPSLAPPPAATAFPTPRVDQRVARVRPAEPEPSADPPPAPRPQPPVEAPVEAPIESFGESFGDPADELFEVRWPSGEIDLATVEGAAPDEADTTFEDDGLSRFVLSSSEVDDDPVDPEMTIAVRRAMAAVSAGQVRGRPVSPVVPVLDDVPDPFDASTDEPDPRSDAGVDDDDPFATFGHDVGDRLDVPLPSRGGSVHARRTALQRLIDGLRNG